MNKRPHLGPHLAKKRRNWRKSEFCVRIFIYSLPGTLDLTVLSEVLFLATSLCHFAICAEGEWHKDVAKNSTSDTWPALAAASLTSVDGQRDSYIILSDPAGMATTSAAHSAGPSWSQRTSVGFVTRVLTRYARSHHTGWHGNVGGGGCFDL